MSVELDPVELGFRRPFDREVEEKLRLRNPNSDPVAFKVKTTAPKQYCVRPNSGRIEPGQTVEVSVLLQAMKEDPPLEAKCRDKFLVQSVAVSAEQEVSNVQTIWSNMESMSKSSIQEKKIRVNFLPADGSAKTPSRQSTANEAPPAYSSPVSPQQYSSTSPTPNTDSKASGTRDTGDTSSSAVGGTSGIPMTSEDVKAQLTEAQTTISNLTRQLSEQGIRQRKSESANKGFEEKSSSSTTAMGMQQAPSGVPVPIVAALCLLSFLIAYILF